MGEKDKILSKFNIKDYRNELELILDNKDFDEEAKSLILSIFYKLDNFYKDYSNLKKQSQTKGKFIEEYINIIKNKCNVIKILSPKDCPKNKKYIINKSKGEIQTFPTENVLFFAINELNENDSYDDGTDFTTKCFINMLNKGKTINNIEPIRDFNGWSWNTEIKNNKNAEYNLIFQNLLILFGYNFIVENMNNKNIINILRNKVNNEFLASNGKDFITCLIQLSIILYNNNSVKNHNECVEYKNRVEKKLESLKNRKSFINDTTQINTDIIRKIHKIDMVLSDINEIRRRFAEHNKNEGSNFFSISDFVKNMENERESLLKEMESNNKSLQPKEYLKNQEKYTNILNIYYDVINDNNYKINMQNKMMKLQKLFLKCIKIKIQENENKKEFYNIATYLRYYANIPYKKYKNIVMKEQLSEEFENVTRELVNKMTENKVIDIGFKTEDFNYKIIKYIFKTKVINLENIILKYKFNSDNQVEVEYYDGNMLDYKECFDIPLDEEVANKKNRKIRLFKV